MRTNAQRDADASARAGMKPFLLKYSEPNPKAETKVILTSAFDNADVIADMGGTKFTGFRQLTGSCVGVSTGDAITTLASIQRLIADAPTKAFICFWGFPYGRCRYAEGDRGQGEGAVDSVMGETLVKEGVFDIFEEGLPKFDLSDGFAISSNLELQYSDGAASVNTKWIEFAKKYPLGTAAVLNSTADMKAAILNGYPVLDGCDNYIGHGSLNGGVAMGSYDGSGGHSTCYIGYWDHPSLGPLFLYWNQWGGNTYPDDGSGKPRCSVWVKEANAARLFNTGGGGGETMALSHLTWFPAQIDKVLDQFI